MSAKILLIDDNHMDREIFRRFILRRGDDITIDEAASGKEAFDKINSNEYDCVFVDYMLPDTDGISILKEIYDPVSELTPYPVVMLTGQAKEEVVIDSIKYGAQEYIIKDNVSTDTLFIAMRKAKVAYDLKESRNRAEEQLLGAQKMEAIGSLTGGIAHDFNNILTIIFGNIRLMEDSLDDDSRGREFLEKKIERIKGAATRGSDLVKRLMVFSRQRRLETKTVKVNELIEDVHKLVVRAIGETIKIKIELGDDLWPVNIDKAQMEHAVINIVVNARDAMPDGGDLVISTKNISIDDGYKYKMDTLPNGEYVMIAFQDAGQGMDQETIKRIFDPFYSTKEVGKGTGLGLSMVHGLIKDLQGDIHVESEVGKGTCFRIFLPKSSKIISDDDNDTVVEELKDRKGQETILIVEDEHEILELAKDLIESQKYMVLTALNGEEALQVIAQNEDINIDLLFTDIAMPGEINGIQLAARALALRPGLQVLFTTGYTKENIPDYNLIEGQYHLINKPYSHSDLLKKIRDIFDN